jgi:two-component system sensor histidine kinase RegB
VTEPVRPPDDTADCAPSSRPAEIAPETTADVRRPANEAALPWSADEGVRAPVFAPAVTFAWIVRLRWGAVFAQAITVLVAAAALDGKLQTEALTALVMLSAASNLGLHVWMRTGERRVRHRVIGAVLMTDAAILTALLYFSGGPSNPFSVLYLVYVTLAALALGIRWALALVGVAAAGYLLLFFAHVPVEGMDHGRTVQEPSAFSMHLQAMWVAFALTGSLIAFVVARLQRALQERDERLAQVWFVAARSEKLASLTTLAAGAAHELGTPLATIAVASKDLETALRAEGAQPALADDARLIRKEVERCRWIVEQMSGRSGEFMGEALDIIAVDDLEQRLREKAASADRLVLDVDSAVPRRLVVPVRGLLQTLGNLIANALEASVKSADARVILGIRRTEHGLQFEVTDRGAGIPESQLARAGEPFFSTRAPGKGMGLGLFLARTFAQEWRGRLDIDSRPGYGTRVRIELPLQSEGGR